MMLETEPSRATSPFKAREAYYRELEKALPVLVKHSPLQFLEWLESTDEQIRFVAIETLNQFGDEIVDHTGTIADMLNRYILKCQSAGRFRELYQLSHLWQKITGKIHELTFDANDISAFMVRHEIVDKETEAYVTLSFTIAKQNGVDISSCQKKITLSNDECSSWIDYQIMVPSTEPVDKVFKMNLHLVDSARDISKHVRQYMIIMFR